MCYTRKNSKCGISLCLVLPLLSLILFLGAAQVEAGESLLPNPDGSDPWMEKNRLPEAHVPGDYPSLQSALLAEFEGTVMLTDVSPQSVYETVSCHGPTKTTTISLNGDQKIIFDELGRIKNISYLNLPRHEKPGKESWDRAGNNWFSDDFNDSVIDPALWTVSGNGVSEGGGVITFFRNGADDSLATSSDYDGGFEVQFESKLTRMEWADEFHGISIKDTLSRGISFGQVRFSIYVPDSTSTVSPTPAASRPSWIVG